MANILIVENEAQLRDALKIILENAGHSVTTSSGGAAAKTVVASQKFDAIVSDVQMPEVDGLELLRSTREKFPTLPFILMTGFSHLYDAHNLAEMGASELVVKPFSGTIMLKVVEETIKRAKENRHATTNDSDFCRVSLTDFVTERKLKYDIYIRIKPDKYLKVGHRDDAVPDDRLQKYKEKGLEYLHIQKEDFQDLVSFNLKVARAVAVDDKISIEKKISFLKYTSEIVLEKAFVDGVDKESFENAQEFLNTTVSVIGDNTELFDLLSHLNGHTNHLYAHSLGVAMYSIMIARRMGWESSQMFFKLSMAGLFHDIGKKEISPEILLKARPLLSQKERTLLESHPTRGKAILEAVQGVPSEVVLVAFQHHEDRAGTGFPLGIKDRQAHPFTKIVNVANVFCEYAISNPNHSGMSGANAVSQMDQNHSELLDINAFSALKTLFPSHKSAPTLSMM